jgi:hypothetical protein
MGPGRRYILDVMLGRLFATPSTEWHHGTLPLLWHNGSLPTATQKPA